MALANRRSLCLHLCLQLDGRMALRFEWDPNKARRNLTRHGVTFEDAQLACEDPARVVRFDRFRGWGGTVAPARHGGRCCAAARGSHLSRPR